MNKFIENNAPILTFIGFALIVSSFVYSQSIAVPKELRGGVYLRLNAMQSDNAIIHKNMNTSIDKRIGDNEQKIELVREMLKQVEAKLLSE